MNAGHLRNDSGAPVTPPDAAAVSSPTAGIDPEAAVVRWTTDLANFANLEVKEHERHLDDVAEDLLIRIDEFEHLLQLSRGDTTACLFKQLPRMAAKFEQMEKVFDKIDRLEFMVARVKADMDKVERRLAEAEATVEGGALSSFMPLLFGAKPHLIGNENSPDVQPKDIFSTEDFFPHKSATKNK